MDRQIKHRKSRRIRETLQSDFDHIPKQSMDWNPQGKRERNQPRKTWNVWTEAANIGKT